MLQHANDACIGSEEMPMFDVLLLLLVMMMMMMTVTTVMLKFCVRRITYIII